MPFTSAYPVSEAAAMIRTTGSYVNTTVVGEAIHAFVPRGLPPADPALDPNCYLEANPCSTSPGT